MRLALLADGSRRPPLETGERATCPGCGAEMIAHCGSQVCSHWAHRSADCDPWSEPMTEWHLFWQDLVTGGDLSLQEIVIGPHRLDAATPTGIRVEVQHSYISVETIREREGFYTSDGSQLVWVFDYRESYPKVKAGKYNIKCRKSWYGNLSRPALIHYDRRVFGVTTDMEVVMTADEHRLTSNSIQEGLANLLLEEGRLQARLRERAKREDDWLDRMVEKNNLEVKKLLEKLGSKTFSPP